MTLLIFCMKLYPSFKISIEATKTCYYWLALSGVGSQPIKLPDVLNLKISITISSWFLASIEATKNMLLGYVSKIPSANQFTVFYIFDLFDLLILIPGAHSYIVLV